MILLKLKITALLLAVSLIPSLSFASGKLTYEEALKTSINNNLSIERGSDTVDNIQNTLQTGIPAQSLSNSSQYQGQGAQGGQYEPNPVSSITQSIQYQTLLDNEQISKQSLTVQKDAIEVNLKAIFVKIKNLEENDKLIKEKINNKNTNIGISRVKYQKGVISKIDLENQEIEVEQLKNSLKENKLQLDMSYKDLANVMNTKIDRKIDYISIPYKTLSQNGISKENVVGSAISQAPTIMQQNSQIKQLEEKIKYSLIDYGNSSLPKEESNTDLNIKDVDLRISKQNIKNAVLDSVNSVENIETNVKNLQTQIDNAKRQAKNLKKLVDLGFKTKIDLENLNLQIKEMELQLENAKSNHGVMIERLKKPYLLSVQG